MPNGFTSETDKAYVAGFFDGDGHISILVQRNHHSIAVGISQKTRDILDWIKEAYGGKAQAHLGLEFCKTVNVVRGGRGKGKTLSNEVLDFRRSLKHKMKQLNACKYGHVSIQN